MSGFRIFIATPSLPANLSFSVFNMAAKMDDVYRWCRPQTLRSLWFLFFSCTAHSVYQPVRSRIILVLPSRCSESDPFSSPVTSGVRPTIISHLGGAGVCPALVNFPSSILRCYSLFPHLRWPFKSLDRSYHIPLLKLCKIDFFFWKRPKALGPVTSLKGGLWDARAQYGEHKGRLCRVEVRGGQQQHV